MTDSDSLSFKDHFSARTGDYAAYRPEYPTELTDLLASASPGQGHALIGASGLAFCQSDGCGC